VEEIPFTTRQIQSTVSIGVAAYPQNGETIEELLLAAKNACFEAQRAGRNKVFRCLTEWHVSEEVLHEHLEEEV
jgi:GGDEF domain-containing protein